MPTELNREINTAILKYFRERDHQVKIASAQEKIKSFLIEHGIVKKIRPPEEIVVFDGSKSLYNDTQSQGDTGPFV